MGDAAVVARPRFFAAAKAAVLSARTEAGLGYGHKGRAQTILEHEGLLDVHMKMWNPFFDVPNADFSCFPMDRLHGV